MKIIVYSHDTYGLGNLRRMLAVCQHLLRTIPELSILLISGSPMVHGFRMPQGLDYIKLPCVGRNQLGELGAKYLPTTTKEVISLRSALIKAAVTEFEPDLLLVDKKPYALVGELKDTLSYLKMFLPQTKVVLLLRDILDSPEKTIQEWQMNHYYEGIECFYDEIWVVGMSELFDLPREYQFPASITEKVKFCGYIRRQAGRKAAKNLRQELQVQPEEKLVLVTSGGGADGYCLVHNYLHALRSLPNQNRLKSVIILGPEMPAHHREVFSEMAAHNPQIQILEFTNDLNSYMAAADVVVSMGGYNTVCEILSLKKPAVVVPRCQPSQEQLIRAERMGSWGLFKVIYPHNLGPENLLQAILAQLSNGKKSVAAIEELVNLNALPQISNYISQLLPRDKVSSCPPISQEKVPQVV